MSQLIACKTKEGIVLAADSKAVDIDANGHLFDMSIERLHPLSQYTVILNSGAAAGEAMCRSLKNFVHTENLRYVDEIHTAALPFLATEYERFMRGLCTIRPVTPIHQFSFILGGFSTREPDRPFSLHLIWTKRKLPMLDSDEIESGFTLPRIIKFEHRLHQLSISQQPLERVMTEVRSQMELLAKTDDEIGEPLAFAYITEAGFKQL